MATSIEEILLRVTGDGDDGKQELAEVAAELEAFDAQEAEAVAELNTRQFRTELKEIERELRSFDRSHADAEVDVDIGDAEFELAVLQRQLAAIDRDDITVDVEIRQQVTHDIDLLRARMASLRSSMSGVDDQSSTTSTFLSRLGSSIDDVASSGGGAGGMFSTLIGYVSRFGGIVAFAAPIVMALVTAIGALVASASAAVAGLGALAIAAGSLLGPALALGIGLFSRFADQAQKAGTAAHALAEEASKFGQAFQRSIGPAADAVFRGAADALGALRPVVVGLKDEFTTFGRAVGSSLSALGKEFSNPAWTKFFSEITRAAATAAPILTEAFIGLSRVLRNIASAAMPALMDAFRGIADLFRGWARGTSDAEALGGAIDTLVGHLKSWLNLGGQLARVVLGFFKAAAPAGQSLVDSIADGASKLADWISSAKGTAQIRGFIDDMLPVLDAVWHLVSQVGEAFVKWSAIAAPAIAWIINAFADIVGAVNDLLDAISSLPGPVRDFVGALGSAAALLATFGALGGALKVIGTVLGGLARFAGFGALLSGLEGLGALLTGPAGIIAALAAGSIALDNFFGGMEKQIAAVVRAINVQRVLTSGFFSLPKATQKAVTGVQGFASATAAAAGRVIGGFQGMRLQVGAVVAGVGIEANKIPTNLAKIANGVRSAGKSVASAFAVGIRGSMSNAVHAANALARAALQAAKTAGQQMRGVGRTIGNLFGQGVNSTRGAASNAGRGIASAVRSAAQGIGRSLSGVGKQVGNLFANGVGSARGAAANAGRSVAQAASSAMQAAAAAASAAGAALGNNFAQGIASAAGAVRAAAAQIAAAARDVLPGSEPKDPNSPLRGLGDAGKAFVGNFASGILKAAGLSDRAVDRIGQRIRNGLRDHLGDLPDDAFGAMQELFRKITRFGPELAGSLGELVDLDKILKGIGRAARRVTQLGKRLKDATKRMVRAKKDLDREDLGSEKIRKLQKLVGSGDLSDNEQKAAEERLKAMMQRRRESLRNELDQLRGMSSDLKDAIRQQQGKIRDSRKELQKALGEVLQTSLSSAISGIDKLKGLGADLSEVIKRIFAEGETGFATSVLRSGDLANSLVGGLPTEDWLKQLVGEIEGQTSATIDEILRQLDLGTQAASSLTGVKAKSTDATSSDGEVHYHYHVEAAATGGEIDPVVALQKIDKEMRRRGRSARVGGRR